MMQLEMNKFQASYNNFTYKNNSNDNDVSFAYKN